MLHLFLGSDQYSKRKLAEKMALENKAELVVAEPGEGDWQKFLETDLFSQTKLFFCSAVIPDFNQEILDKLVKTGNLVVLSVESLDKRKSENKKLLERTDIEIRNFVLPHATELNHWLKERYKELGGEMDPLGAEELAKRLGRDNGKEIKAGGRVVAAEEVYSLWQAENELLKLRAFCGQRVCTEADVKMLVTVDLDIDPFAITNAIADGQKSRAYAYIEELFKNQAPAERKNLCINLNALLAEQFRNIYLIQGLLSDRVQDEEILQQTGWKPGRLFVIKKISAKFQAKKVLETLKKLAALDWELKTGNLPERMMLDLILVNL